MKLVYIKDSENRIQDPKTKEKQAWASIYT